MGLGLRRTTLQTPKTQGSSISSQGASWLAFLRAASWLVARVCELASQYRASGRVGNIRGYKIGVPAVALGEKDSGFSKKMSSPPSPDSPLPGPDPDLAGSADEPPVGHASGNISMPDVNSKVRGWLRKAAKQAHTWHCQQCQEKATASQGLLLPVPKGKPHSGERMPSSGNPICPLKTSASTGCCGSSRSALDACA